MSDDLVTWLRQAFDDEERTAQTGAMAMGMDEPVYPDYRTYNGQEQEDADAYLIRFSPARVLAEVAAKRAILDLHRPDHRIQYDLGPEPVHTFGPCGECFRNEDEPGPWPCQTLRLLAQPIADRPGYQESWRPA